MKLDDFTIPSREEHPLTRPLNGARNITVLSKSDRLERDVERLKQHVAFLLAYFERTDRELAAMKKRVISQDATIADIMLVFDPILTAHEKAKLAALQQARLEAKG